MTNFNYNNSIFSVLDDCISHIAVILKFNKIYASDDEKRMQLANDILMHMVSINMAYTKPYTWPVEDANAFVDENVGPSVIKEIYDMVMYCIIRKVI